MGRRVALAVCLLACSLCAASAAGSGGGGGPSVRPQPLTSAEFDRATHRFLDSLPSNRDARADVAGGGSGGTGQEGEGGQGDLFPDDRVVAYYGAPQMGATIVGRKSVQGAKKGLRQQARPYEGEGREVVLGFDLVAVLATADSGGDGKYRSRQSNRAIGEYLRAAEALNGRLILDIQPGQSTFINEVRALREWLVRPNVDIALDPEWNVGPHGRPGHTVGSVNAKTLNRVSAYMSNLVERESLPQKALVIHQFRDGSVKKRKDIKQPEGVDVVLNFDGIGGAAAKKAGYARLTREDLFAGFSLFYRLDSGLMKPSEILRLEPEPDFLLYQ
jgi:hypothetical protein